MADHEQRLQAFVKLGNFLSEYCKYSGDPPVNLPELNPLFPELDEKVAFAGHKNGWFTKENILFSFEHWGRILTEKNLTNWLSAYDLSSNGAIRVAVIMAGNIPLVGFHDFLSVLLTGNRVLCKLSSNDPVLLPFLGGFLEDIN
ncbi:MAG TPA: acyl-CoA reductase, partial [Eudoraea sp.]|nr:acyl-CoA reductase [Eudoraea sp.]